MTDIPLPTPTIEQVQKAQALIAQRVNQSAAAAIEDHRRRAQPLLDVYRATTAFLQGRSDKAALQSAVDSAHQRMAELAIGGED